MTDIVDIGANLTNKAFRGDLALVIERAAAEGVRPIVVTGTSVDASQVAVELARKHPRLLYATAGIHPHHARTFGPPALAALRELAACDEVVALGECGLDYNRNYSPEADQLACFEAQLELSAELGLPLFLHERDAHEAFVRLIEHWRPKLTRAVVHCFTGTAAELERYLALDLHIGVTGWICDERRGQELKQLVGRIPENRLMIETDAPYLLPRDLLPKPPNRRNEPAFLRHVLAAVAACRNQPIEAVARATTATAVEFFGLEPAEAQNHCFGGGT
jgi:TatD DNase family protein